MSTPIPGPPAWPVIGNLPDVDINDSVRCFTELAGTYGPIYKLRLGGDDRIIISSQELVNEVCSRKEFVKIPIGGLRELQKVTPDGLFTAPHGQESWGIAHRTLLPALGPIPVQEMLPEMLDIASQAVLRWARAGESNLINLTEDLTRLTLDTLALCTMDTRFNSFYKEERDPFVEAIRTVLIEAQVRPSRPAFVTSFMWTANRKFDDANAYIHQVASEVVAKRRANASSTSKNDLLDAMLNRQDPLTGRKLDDNIIVDNMITFLVAGHEATSGLLSFLFYLLVTHPDAYSMLQQEIDQIVGQGPIRADHLSKLQYVKACIRESLRLYPTAPIWGVSPLFNDSGDEEYLLLGNKWAVRRNQTVLVLNPKLHRDPAVFGDDAEEFKPERMLEDRFRALPKNCWKPFGNGTRACIGQEFAMQEAILATTLLFQKFDFRLADQDYKLSIQQTLTIKPTNLFMHAKLRKGVNIMSLQRDMFNSQLSSARPNLPVNGGEISSKLSSSKEMQSISLFYGSNTGTAKGLAERFSVSAFQRGFKCTVKSLDEAIGSISTHHSVIFFVASYEEHPGNGTKFIEWLENSHDLNLEGVNFSVFGCGNRDWFHTYQITPTLVQRLLEDQGATLFAERGATDASQGDILGDFERWETDHLWPGISKLYGQVIANNEPRILPSLLNQDFGVVSSERLQVKVTFIKKMAASSLRPKYHIELELPQGTTYNVGDYLEVYPQNSQQDLERLLQVLKISRYEDADPIITTIFNRFELNQPATSHHIRKLVQNCLSKEDKISLGAIADEVSETPQNAAPTVLQLLIAYPSISVSLDQLATMLPFIRPRSYSISSSPTSSPSKCTLTWSLLSRPALKHPRHEDQSPILGLASSFLARLAPGDKFEALVRPGKDRFKPPNTPNSVPMIMVCAGAGIAPFRAFVEHRAEMIRHDPSASQTLAPALLYVGCRNKQEALYVDELAQWEEAGAVKVRWVYSRPVSGSEGASQGSRYVQNEVWADKDEVVSLWDKGARIYICGSRELSQGMRDIAKRMYEDVARSRCGPKDEQAIDEWWLDIIRERYSVDVF